MNNTPPSATPKKKYSSALIAVIVCAAIVAVAVTVAILNPGDGFDIIPSLTGDIRSKVHYSDMEYVRPDTDKLISDIEELTAMVIRGESFTDQRSLYNRILIACSDLDTMSALASVRYSSDVTDDFYFNERYTLGLAIEKINAKLDELLDTIAFSNFKTNYERTFFGVGYFTDWKGSTVSDQLAALLDQEERLISDYSKLMLNPFVTLDGNKIYINSSDYRALSPEKKAEADELYINEYGSLAGNIFVELVKTRKEIAAKRGTDYLSYVYGNLGRDYTPLQVQSYLDSINTFITPILDQITPKALNTKEVDSSHTLYALADATQSMGKIAKEAFEYMFDYGLYDISLSAVKAPRSYNVFLKKYETPFMFVSPSGTVDDYLTVAYQFGTFADMYYNRTSITDEKSESAALAMSYLLPYYTNAFTSISADDVTDWILSDIAYVFTELACITEFEHKVYALAEDEITLEKINQTAMECVQKYNVKKDYSEWFTIAQLYRAPLKSAGTVISNDVALQVLNAETGKQGSGIDFYVKLIDRDRDLSFTEDLVASGFESPFADRRCQKAADLLLSIANRNTSGEPDDETPPAASSSNATAEPTPTPESD